MEDEGLRTLADRIRRVEEMEVDLALRRAEVARMERELDALKAEYQAKLDATRTELEVELAHELGNTTVRALATTALQAETDAKRVLIGVMERHSAAWTGQATTTLVRLPNDDVKGKLIGREGRNIKAFEQVTGTELIIDETPAMVTLSCFDPRRRLVAELTLMNLVLDGRIHPGRIEEIHVQTEAQFEANLPDIGTEAAERSGVGGLPIEIQTKLGALKFRHSQGQNVLEHSVEVAHMAAGLAAETGADPAVSRRAGLLHDIGKVLGPEWGEGHAVAGAAFLSAYGEGEGVVHAVRSHHYDTSPQTPEAHVLIVADSVSGSRPGARSAQEAVHLARLGKLEALATQFQGVDRAIAYDSGRELRVFVAPEAIDDLAAVRLAKQVARVIRSSGEYSGPVKVVVIRETRAVEVSG